MKKVCVVGLGYIGLPTSIVAAQAGLSVVGVDIDKDRIDAINQGKAVIKEPDLQKHLQQVLATKNFKATAIYEPADYFIIAVPTPFTSEKKADLSYVFSAAIALASVLKQGDTVILESTVPVGTTATLGKFLAEKTGLECGIDFFVAHCPERVLPGNIFHELRVNDRIIGGTDRGATKHVAEFYKHFVSGDLYLTTAETAEMTKLVENSYRDVTIAISHQVASMAHKVGINPYEVIELANKHPRVNLLRPTVGVGGHCLAVDPWFLVETFPEQTVLFKTAREINDAKPQEVIYRIEKAVEQWGLNHTKPPRILLLGAAYKPDVDDMRESPALTIIKALVGNKDYLVSVYDPHVAFNAHNAFLQKYQIQTIDISFEEYDIIAVLVAHTAFKSFGKKIIAHKKVLDFCGLFHEPRQHTKGQEQLYWPSSLCKEDEQYQGIEPYPQRRAKELL